MVDVGTVRVHDVVGEAVGVVAVAVVNAQRGQQPAGLLAVSEDPARAARAGQVDRWPRRQRRYLW